MPRRSRLLAPVAATVVVIVVVFLTIVNFWTDYKWFNAIGFTSVFMTELWTRVLLFAVAAAVMAVIVGSSIYFAYRSRPGVRPMSLEQQGLDRYRQSIDPHRKLFFWLAVGALAVLAGAAASGDWRAYLQFVNGTDFGTADPEFGMDIAFFAFTYPFLRILLGYLYAAVILAFVAAVIVHYLYGGVRLQNDSGQRATPSARVHLSVLLGLFVLLRAGSYWLDRYGLVFSDRGYTFGASYTDVHAVKTALLILTVISVICAALFFANIYFKNTLVPMSSLGLLLLSAVLVGVAYPEIVQRFQVDPNEQRLESPYIERNIEYTRQAYDIADAEVEPYDATTELSAQDLVEESQGTTVRLADPSVVSQTFQQMQQVRGFYQFPDVLEVDRYPDSEGNLIDTIVAVRELDGPPSDQNNWLNRHLIYTHGYGMVASSGTQIDAEGRPVFTEYNIPPRGELSEVVGEYQPRVYYGREGAEYVIVEAEEEYDYPLDAEEEGGDVPTPEDAVDPEISPSPDEARAPADAEQEAADGGGGEQSEAPAEGEGGGEGAEADPEGGSQAVNRYDGEGGVELNNFFDRVLYAIKYQEPNILLNNAITDSSRILYERDPLERVERVAPYLTVDSRPYPAIVDGRIQWIVDAYTTSDGYPYANRIDFNQAVTDTFTEGSAQEQVGTIPGNEVNYIRNSVKATVDAYDGSVVLYAWDEEDPVLQTWMEAFPDTVELRGEMSDELVDHVRYPDDLFKVQRQIMREYHVTDAAAYYGGQDFWTVPTDPTGGTEAPEPPYRQTIQYPGTEEATFSLTSTFVPRGRENLAAFMAVNSDPRSEDYGQLQLLELPRSTVIFGPGQVQNAFDADAAVREVLLPLEQSNAEVTRGNLLTLPFAGGLLYVEPLYVQAGGGGAASFPLLQQVMVGFGEEVAIGSNLPDALSNLFDGGGAAPEEGGGEEPPPEEGSTDGGGGGDQELTESLNEAVEAWEEAQESNEQANERLREALEDIQRQLDEN